MRALLSTALAVVLSISLLGQVSIPRPDAGGNPSSATPVAAQGEAAGCSELGAYQKAVNTAVNKSGTFAGILNSNNPDYANITTEQGKQIIADGNSLISVVQKLKAPVMYADGGKGLIILFTYINQEVLFYTIDSSKVPDTNSYSKAFQLIRAGELNAAKECPAEIKKIGGYVFIDPTTIDPNS